MSTQWIGALIIIVLLISLIPNAYMLYKTSKTDIPNTRYKLMVGVDAMLLVLVIAAILILK
ncbi:hypothetical protein [Staphylococcus lutrae]|uniref:Uncharacterized protein n=1 Tax=Staphylococcus lutrae TaxID=155085 RepID=A0AAC9WIV6_9STAP|nr:hypothetical protein [Staphylococcus lutrae]ARJ50475.1 hypothetical protein B5P37_03690 [Staphylococcus lutrae]PNZ38203.1 hypothetical protein CD134_04955 [Staphylococcus lutrae]